MILEEGIVESLKWLYSRVNIILMAALDFTPISGDLTLEKDISLFTRILGISKAHKSC